MLCGTTMVATGNMSDVEGGTVMMSLISPGGTPYGPVLAPSTRLWQILAGFR